MMDRNIGKRISQLRKPGETQIEFAARLKVTQASVSRYLNGSKPNREALLKIAKITGASMDWLLTGRQGGGLEPGLGKGKNKPIRDNEVIDAAVNNLDKLDGVPKPERNQLKAMVRDIVTNPARLKATLSAWEASKK